MSDSSHADVPLKAYPRPNKPSVCINKRFPIITEPVYEQDEEEDD